MQFAFKMLLRVMITHGSDVLRSALSGAARSSSRRSEKAREKLLNNFQIIKLIFENEGLNGLKGKWYKINLFLNIFI